MPRKSVVYRLETEHGLGVFTCGAVTLVDAKLGTNLWRDMPPVRGVPDGSWNCCFRSIRQYLRWARTPEIREAFKQFDVWLVVFEPQTEVKHCDRHQSIFQRDKARLIARRCPTRPFKRQREIAPHATLGVDIYQAA